MWSREAPGGGSWRHHGRSRCRPGARSRENREQSDNTRHSQPSVALESTVRITGVQSRFWKILPPAWVSRRTFLSPALCFFSFLIFLFEICTVPLILQERAVVEGPDQSSVTLLQGRVPVPRRSRRQVQEQTRPQGRGRSTLPHAPRAPRGGGDCSPRLCDAAWPWGGRPPPGSRPAPLALPPSP